MTGITPRSVMLFGLIVFLGGCARRDAPSQLGLTATPLGPDTRVALVAAHGLKVNARVKPALELTDGRVVRFDSPLLTPDSAYFTAPPVAVLTGRHDRIRGTLRASVCGVDEQVCRTVTVVLD